MMIATTYKLNEEGKTFEGMQLIIRDWFITLEKEHRNCEWMKYEDDLNILLHHDTYGKLRRSAGNDLNTFQFGLTTNYGNLPVIDIGVKMIGLKVKASICIGKDEMVIISDGLLELFEKFAERVHKEGYHKGQLDAYIERRF